MPKTRIRQLIAEKQARDGGELTISQVSRDTGISRQTIHTWLDGDLQLFRAPTIRAFTSYFDCEIGDLFYDDNPKENEA